MGKFIKIWMQENISLLNIIWKKRLKDIDEAIGHISNNISENEIKQFYIDLGVSEEKIISLKDYRKKLGFLGNVYAFVMFIPSMLGRVKAYIIRNGLRGTISKIKSRIENDEK